MKKYKRLTERVGKGICVKETSTSDNRSIWNAIERLAELEDKIENGTLIELSCKVGDTVYCIAHSSRGKFINSITIRTIYDIFDLWDYFCNKTVFLTKAEAEKALAELEKKK